MRRGTLVIVVSAVLLAATALPTAAARAADNFECQILWGIDVPEAINNLGHVLGGGMSLWSPENGLEHFPHPSGWDVDAYDINDTDVIVGVVHPDEVERRVFTWTRGGGFQTLPAPPEYDEAQNAGINNAGAVVATWADWQEDTTRAFYRSSGGDWTELDVPGGYEWVKTCATRINDSNRIVGEWEWWIGSTFRDAACRWDTVSGALTDIGPAGDVYSSANDVNNLGEAVGSGAWETEPGVWPPRALLYDLGGVAHILGEPGTEARGINDHGHAVGSYLWWQGSVWDLNDLVPGGQMVWGATAVNNHLQIVGTADRGDGYREGCLLTPELHYKAGGGSDRWEDAQWSWGVTPAYMHPVFIDPVTGSFAVYAPETDTTVKRLTIGGGGGEATFLLRPDVEFTATEDVFLGEGGTLAGDGNIGNDVINQFGTVSPGSSAGRITILGDYTQQHLDARLQIDLGGLIPVDEHDVLAVNGLLTFGGHLEVRLIEDFVPCNGDRFDVLDWGRRTGEFSSFDLPDLTGGLQWDLSDLYVTGEITVTPEPTTLSLLMLVGTALGGLALVRRRRG